jgi:glycosyltransferase involved in cell wall biosynthesis
MPNPLSSEFSRLEFQDRFGRQPLQRIAFIGRLEPGKGVESIVNAALVLPQLDFHIWGDSYHAGAEYRQRLEAGAPVNVTFHGHTANVPDTINKHNIQVIIVPSIAEEAFGLAAIESMAMSCLTLVRPSGALAELGGIALTFSMDSDLISLLNLWRAAGYAQLLKQVRKQYDFAQGKYGYRAEQNMQQEINKMLNT